jgi:hypothetical protein
VKKPRHRSIPSTVLLCKLIWFVCLRIRYGVAAPDMADETSVVKKPRPVPYFDGKALRHLALHEKYGGLNYFERSNRVSCLNF